VSSFKNVITYSISDEAQALQVIPYYSTAHNLPGLFLSKFS
jgi:hypothetical protein